MLGQESFSAQAAPAESHLEGKAGHKLRSRSARSRCCQPGSCAGHTAEAEAVKQEGRGQGTAFKRMTG